jgi:DivIVA domain-containing protein
MDDERIVISSSAAISPEAVAGKGFTTSMRGYQPAEVRQFLNKVAEELAAAGAREAELRHTLQETQARAAHPELDEAVLTASLGEHAGRLIASARETAAAITAEAERTAAATLRDAEYRIARIRQEADTLMARRVEEADGVSASLRQSAEADARAVRDQAQAEAEAAIQAARSHGKEMVAEARAVRERMLGDLARRRRVAEVQLEQLRVARARLVEAYEVVRRTLEEVTAELAAAEPEARLAAEAVGRRMTESDPGLRLSDPPLRVSDHPPLRPASTALPSPLGRPQEDAGPQPMAPAADESAGASPPGPEAGPFQPSRLAPTHPSTTDVAEPDASGSWSPEPPPVPPGWIERAGGSGRGTSPPSPTMPPSVAGPATGYPDSPDAGRPDGSASDDLEAWDPGTWAGAGFGPPRDAGSPLRPADPGTGTAPAGPSPAPTGSRPGDAPAMDSGAAPAPPRGPVATAIGERMPPAAPTRPPLRPQTVADSLPARSRLAVPPVAGSRPMPPDLPVAVPPALAEQPPELATAEVPSIRPAGDAPALVEELFARLRDQVPAPAPDAAPSPAAPARPGPADDVVNEGALALRDEQLDPLDADLTRSLKRILQDEQNEVLERLRHEGRAAISGVVAALDHQTAQFATAAAPALTAAFQAGGGDADDTTGLALAGRLAADLTAPIRERLERVATGGDDAEELAEAVRAAYRHAKLQEIEQLVRHHTAAAHAMGVYAATARGSLLRWVVEDDAPCPDCYDNTLAGPTPKGEPFPTGQEHPPAHLGCRCLLVPVS